MDVELSFQIVNSGIQANIEMNKLDQRLADPLAVMMLTDSIKYGITMLASYACQSTESRKAFDALLAERRQDIINIYGALPPLPNGKYLWTPIDPRLKELLTTVHDAHDRFREGIQVALAYALGTDLQCAKLNGVEQRFGMKLAKLPQ